MTGTQGLALFIAGPVLAVVAAVAAKSRPAVILGAAVLGEVVAYLMALFWSGRAVQAVLAENRFTLVVQTKPGIGTRLSALTILLPVALLVGALGIGAQYVMRRRRA